MSSYLSQPLPPAVRGSIKGTGFEFEKSGWRRGLLFLLYAEKGKEKEMKKSMS